MHINGLDEKDNEIVNLLLKNGRMSYSEIGEKVGLSRTAVKNRIYGLETSGIISGYRAIINPQESSEMMTFVVNVETTPDQFEQIKVAFAAAPETVTLVQTTGKCHLVAFCVSKDVGSMRDFVNQFYKSQNGVLSMHAHAVLDVIKGVIAPEL